MTKAKGWRPGVAAWLAAAVLIGSSLGCNAAASKATSPNPPKTDQYPADKKDGTVKPPPPDPG